MSLRTVDLSIEGDCHPLHVLGSVWLAAATGDLAELCVSGVSVLIVGKSDSNVPLLIFSQKYARGGKESREDWLLWWPPFEWPSFPTHEPCKSGIMREALQQHCFNSFHHHIKILKCNNIEMLVKLSHKIVKYTTKILVKIIHIKILNFCCGHNTLLTLEETVSSFSRIC